jgi:hypothetical protein
MVVHPSLRQKNRLTCRRMNISWPPAAVSASRRSYRLCTRTDRTPHAGQSDPALLVLAWIRTDFPAVKTRSTARPAS